MSELRISQIANALNVSKRAAEQRADREAWRYRIVAGTGSPRVYRVADLPHEVRSKIEKQTLFDIQKQVHARQIATVSSANLTARQRQVMEARSALLVEIDRRALVEGMKITAAIRSFADDSAARRLTLELATIVAVANDRSGGDARVAERVLFQWRSAQQRGGVAALAPLVTKSEQDLPVWFREFRTFYAVPQKPTVARALAQWQKQAPGRTLPSYSQVLRVLKKLSSLDRMRGREGMLALKARQAYNLRDASDLLPASLYAADGKTFDAEIAHPMHGRPFRPELTTIIDAHTRRIVGWSVALDESGQAVSDALRMACTGACIPAIFYTDRGPGYVNERMDAPLTGLLGRLGITPMRALPYNSQGKGIVERVNQIWSDLARDLPTYISRDMDREAKQAAFKETRKDLALIGTSRLLPRWEEFLRRAQATVDWYNDRHHRGLSKIADPVTGRRRHMSPNEAWRTAVAEGFEPIIVAASEADDLFHPWVERQCRRALVEWLGNSYFALDLEAYDGKKVIVAYDIHDASRVWVRAIELDAAGDRQPGRLIAIATFEGHKTRYVSVNAEQAAMERRGAARERRLQNKIEVVRQELHPAALLEAGGQTARFAAIHPLSTDDVEDCAENAIAADSHAPTSFGDDISLVRWVMDHPSAVKDHQIAYICDLLNSGAAREEFRMLGVDLHALRKLVSRPVQGTV